MNPEVDAYLERAERWPATMAALRPVLLDCGLDEQIKWRTPCFSHGGKNIVIFQEMKQFLALMFFKGALLADPDAVLHDQGPNSRSARRMQFTSVEEVHRAADTVRAYVAAAIEVETSGRDVGPAPELVMVEELATRLDDDAALRVAFEGLTPGRQREYNLYFAGAKQAKTRVARIEKYRGKILDGKGFRDR